MIPLQVSSKEAYLNTKIGKYILKPFATFEIAENYILIRKSEQEKV